MKGSQGEKKDARLLSGEVYTTTDPTLKTVQPAQKTMGISGW